MKPSIDIHTCTCTRIYYYTCMYYFDFTLYLLQSQYCMCIRFQFYLNLHTCNGVVLWSVQGCLAPYERKLVEVTFAPQFQQGGRGWEHREAPPTQRDYALFLKFILVDTHSSTSEGHTLTVIYTLLLIVLPYTCIHVHVYCTVEPLGNITFGTCYSVHYREVAFFGVSFNGGSITCTCTHTDRTRSWLCPVLCVVSPGPGLARSPDPLELAVTGCARPVLLRVEPGNTLTFDPCPTGKSASKQLQVSGAPSN